MQMALALIEFDGAAAGILAVDRMLKMAPVALLRCGTVHPGRYLALLGGSVAATIEAHGEGVMMARDLAALCDEVCLPDPDEQLVAAVTGSRREPAGEAVGVFEIGSSPGLLRALDATLKSVPLELVEVRLADDLGGRGLAIVAGRLPDVQEGLQVAHDRRGEQTEWLRGTVLPRLDDTLRDVLTDGTRFSACRAWQPVGAEQVEE